MVINYLIGMWLDVIGGEFKHFKRYMFEEDPETNLLYQIVTGAKGGQTGAPTPNAPVGPEGAVQNQQGLPQGGMEQMIRSAQIAGRAEGGPIQQGQPYVVGEKGPEVIIPNQNGTVIPNGEQDYGLRLDNTQKGEGWLGPLPHSNGKISTELSIGVNINGKETLIPSLVPTLTREEVLYLLNGGKPTKEIINKAVDFAVGRIKLGKSPFK
jgi:hypothetical protein